jgi:hypothetical protein
MSSTRERGLRYLERLIGKRPPICVAVSKLYEPDESWTGKQAWWFDLPIQRVAQLASEDYYLVGEWGRDGFVVLRVPNQFLLENQETFDTKYGGHIRLHLAAYDENWLVDERVSNGLDFSKFELKQD